MVTIATFNPRRILGILRARGRSPLPKSGFGPEIVAGITLAAIGIPEVMGYTKIAGMPVITGLYTILVPIALFAVLGSSRHLVVGADSATAAIMAAGLAGMADLVAVREVRNRGDDPEEADREHHNGREREPAVALLVNRLVCHVCPFLPLTTPSGLGSQGSALR